MNPGLSGATHYTACRRGSGWGREKRGKDGPSGGWFSFQTGLRCSGTQTHFPQAYKGKRKSSRPVTADGRNRERGKAEGANRPRWPHSSGVPVPVLTLETNDALWPFPLPRPASPDAGGPWRENSRSWGSPLGHRGPKPGKDSMPGSEPCQQSNCLPF